MHRLVTMKDVATHAGVSLSTVSRVLNHNEKVDVLLRERVLASMKELNYTPNEIARNLKANRSRAIAFIVSNTDDHYFTSVSRGIESVITEEGYNLIVCNTYFDKDKELSFLELFRERRISGMVINTVGGNDKAIAEMSRTMPTVLCSRKVLSDTFQGDLVDFDSVGGMFQLTRHLLDLGHRKIALINGNRALSTAAERYMGFCNAMREAGLNGDRWDAERLEKGSQFTEEYGYRAAKAVMQLPDRPTAMIATNSMLAAGALRYLKETQIRIPEELSFCHFDNLPHSGLFFCEPTFMNTDRLTMGSHIGQLLLSRIAAQEQMNNREITLPTTLVQGDSTAKIEQEG